MDKDRGKVRKEVEWGEVPVARAGGKGEVGTREEGAGRCKALLVSEKVGERQKIRVGGWGCCCDSIPA